MKIIVDIPKKDYIYIFKKHCLPSCDDKTLKKAYCEMISKGMPLDKVRDEIMELARFHSIEVPMVYGDGMETTDKMVSLEELGRILSEIEDTIGGEL